MASPSCKQIWTIQRWNTALPSLCLWVEAGRRVCGRALCAGGEPLYVSRSLLHGCWRPPLYVALLPTRPWWQIWGSMVQQNLRLTGYRGPHSVILPRLNTYKKFMLCTFHCVCSVELVDTTALQCLVQTTHPPDFMQSHPLLVEVPDGLGLVKVWYRID